MKNTYDYCVFIGRFSPFHDGHKAILDEAFRIGKEVIVVIGSADTARNTRNPWTAIERQQMIVASLDEDKFSRIKFIHMKDYLYNNNMWVSVLQEKLNKATNDNENVALIGFKSDETSFYLSLFPQYTYVEHGTKYDFHATTIRDKYFTHDDYSSMVPQGTFHFLKQFSKTSDFNNLYNEYKYICDYKEKWRGAPFPPTFLTADCLVIKSGHILIVRRGHNPGKGLLALPGGFVNQKELIEDAALRELKEETGIKVNTADLRRSIIKSKVFDDPNRSSRGRTITHAFLIDLGSGTLPKVKGDDDAADAFWLPLSDFYTLEASFFEDHFHIIRNLVSGF